MRVLIVGRSPNVLLEAVDILRSRGYQADATNQFADVLSDYDVADLDILIFGGMVPAETKQYLREEVAKVNPAVTFVQGLAGMSGLIAAQVDAVATTGGTAGTATADAPAESPWHRRCPRTCHWTENRTACRPASPAGGAGPPPSSAS